MRPLLLPPPEQLVKNWPFIVSIVLPLPECHEVHFVWWNSLNTACNAALLAISFLSFASLRVFVSPSRVKDHFTGYQILVWQYFFLSALCVFYSTLCLPEYFLKWCPILTLIPIPLQVKCFLSVTSFKIVWFFAFLSLEYDIPSYRFFWYLPQLVFSKLPGFQFAVRHKLKNILSHYFFCPLFFFFLLGFLILDILRQNWESELTIILISFSCFPLFHFVIPFSSIFYLFQFFL